MAIEKILLSGTGADSQPFQSDGTNNYTIHTASSTATDIDEVWLWACNVGAADVVATVGWGQAGYTASNSIFTVTSKAGLYLMTPGLVLKGNATAQKIVNVFADSASSINWVGYVNRHSV
tara:strand:+ start:834 stop:1193 length:360 start_codon:yes stop_codon:yes gene_type:complete